MFIIIFLYPHPVSGAVSIASRNLIITVMAGWGGVGTRWMWLSPLVSGEASTLPIASCLRGRGRYQGQALVPILTATLGRGRDVISGRVSAASRMKKGVSPSWTTLGTCQQF